MEQRNNAVIAVNTGNADPKSVLSSYFTIRHRHEVARLSRTRTTARTRNDIESSRFREGKRGVVAVEGETKSFDH